MGVTNKKMDSMREKGPNAIATSASKPMAEKHTEFGGETRGALHKHDSGYF